MTRGEKKWPLWPWAVSSKQHRVHMCKNSLEEVEIYVTALYPQPGVAILFTFAQSPRFQIWSQPCCIYTKIGTPNTHFQMFTSKVLFRFQILCFFPVPVFWTNASFSYNHKTKKTSKLKPHNAHQNQRTVCAQKCPLFVCGIRIIAHFMQKHTGLFYLARPTTIDMKVTYWYFEPLNTQTIQSNSS